MQHCGHWRRRFGLGIEICRNAFADTLEPASRRSVAEWANSERWLTSEDSSEPGRYSTDRTPYIVEPLNVLGPDGDCSEVILMFASQTAKTNAMLTFIGYVMSEDPGPIMAVMPTLDLAKAWSKDRLDPMLKATPCLQGLVADARSRDSGNQTLAKRFRGGSLTITGANSPAALSSRPIRYLLMDEVDRFPASAGHEGSPESLAAKRTISFSANRKILRISSPTDKTTSSIAKHYATSDQRSFWVPCPFCGEFQVLRWARVSWSDDEPEAAHYRCCGCEGLIPHYRKAWMLGQGEWRAANPGARVAGFWLSQLYSPFASWGDTAVEFLAAKHGGPETLRVFINTGLAEVWDDERTTNDVTENLLLARREIFTADVPAEACVLTAGVDVQDDRIECEVVGWAPGDENWSVDYRVFLGDPSGPNVWAELDTYLLSPWQHEGGARLNILATCVDSGGHNTQAVYRFAAARYGRRVFAIRGVSGAIPIWSKKPSKGQSNHNVWGVGVDSAKASVMAWLSVPEAGLPGYCHFPMQRDSEYFSQLLSEFLKTEYKAGRPSRTWVRKTGRAAEALDCRVYALAALEALRSMGFRIERAQADLRARAAACAPAVAQRESPEIVNGRQVTRSRFIQGSGLNAMRNEMDRLLSGGR